MENSNVSQIKLEREAFRKAFNEGNIDAIMSSFHGEELVFFDIMPPFQFVGYDAFRESWVKFLGPFNGTQKMEITDLHITTSDDIAFIRHFTRVKGTMNGQQIDIWTRESNGLRKINGKWLVVEGHVSVPSDLATGRALLDLKP